MTIGSVSFCHLATSLSLMVFEQACSGLLRIRLVQGRVSPEIQLLTQTTRLALSYPGPLPRACNVYFQMLEAWN
ncbi:hypothetical protein RRG08_055908 [Elysia crispata]|uniref:Secreted protein n=1 Tax=Elysia crispata TaxID=231223 RepID=A0AAE0Y4K9_9GAST|nr:hypothetical protein RRG08_055908 [Elysia crispata]